VVSGGSTRRAGSTSSNPTTSTSWGIRIPRRLIARNQFRNTINAFTGIAYDWENAAKDRLRLFYTLPHYRLPDDRAGIRMPGAVAHEGAVDLDLVEGEAAQIADVNEVIYGVKPRDHSWLLKKDLFEDPLARKKVG